ncbi:MAG: hypothetical protein LBH49_00990 [Puniceicoccales bacterium]|jgi:hypothetical protein|nr:hypothetical protein [Puniceicoccales bacterium]
MWFGVSAYANIIEVNNKDSLVDVLDGLITGNAIDLEKTITFVDIDDTIIYNCSDFKKSVPDVVSESFVLWLTKYIDYNYRIVGLTSGMTYFIQPLSQCTENDDCISCFIKRDPHANIRVNGMHELGIKFWNPFNDEETFLPFVYDPCISSETEIENEFLKLKLGNSVIYKEKKHTGLFIEKFADGQYNEISAWPVFLNGIIFSNFARMQNICSHTQCHNGERKGDVIISFLKKLAEIQKSKNFRDICDYVLVIDDNINMLRNIESVLNFYGIETIAIHFNWKNMPTLQSLASLNINHIELMEKYQTKSLNSDDSDDMDDDGNVHSEKLYPNPDDMDNDGNAPSEKLYPNPDDFDQNSDSLSRQLMNMKKSKSCIFHQYKDNFFGQ